MTSKIIFLTEVIDQKVRKQQELEFYEKELVKLQQKMFFVKKEIETTNIIIDIIQQESVLDIREYVVKKVLTDTNG
jgi:hypothetical protein